MVDPRFRTEPQFIEVRPELYADQKSCAVVAGALLNFHQRLHLYASWLWCCTSWPGWATCKRSWRTPSGWSGETNAIVPLPIG